MAMEQIFDPLRKKMVALTPEERVRQQVIMWLRDSEGIPEIRMMSEYPFNYNGRNYRADIMVFDRNLKPEIMVECKAPSVKIDSKVIDQVIRYARVLAAKTIIVTNGIDTKSFTLKGESDNA